MSCALKECRRDPAWEARNGIVNRVICRVCGEFKSEINANREHSHLRKHHMIVERSQKEISWWASRQLCQIRSPKRAASKNENCPRVVDEAASYLTPNELTK